MDWLSVLRYFLGLVKAPLKRSRSTADGADEDSQDQLQELLESGAMDEEQKTDNTTLLRLLEEGEKVCSTPQLYICQSLLSIKQCGFGNLCESILIWSFVLIITVLTAVSHLLLTLSSIIMMEIISHICLVGWLGLFSFLNLNRLI